MKSHFTAPITTAGVMLGLAVALSACMTSPKDRTKGQGIYYRSSTITFTGRSLESSAGLWLEAKNPSTGSWDTIKSFTGGTTYTYWQGYNWYNWSTTAVIPNQYWIAGYGGGYRAEVKTQYDYNGQDFMSVRADWDDCFAENLATGIDAVYDNCRAPNSPSSWVITEDYSETSFHSCYDTQCVYVCQRQCRDAIIAHGPLFSTGTSYGSWYNSGSCCW
ncbi:MAG: hypothetical protein IPI67_13110 [Myxococcales bacterium]|nr:hypothetical protein [Myxococcales bacterium]